MLEVENIAKGGHNYSAVGYIFKITMNWSSDKIEWSFCIALKG